MSARASRNNVIVGLFLILSLALAVAISFWLGGVGEAMGRKTRYAVHFPAEVGAAGLKPGSAVTVAGQPAGRVLSVEPWIDTTPSPSSPEPLPRLRGMRVSISVDNDYTLYQDAQATLVVPLVGGISSINIGSVGGVRSATPLAPGGTLDGTRAPGLLAQAGLNPDDIDALLRDVRAGIANFNDISARVADMTKTLESRFGTGTEDLFETVANARALTDDLRSVTSRLPGQGGIADRIDEVVNNARDTLAKGPKLLDDASETMASIRASADEARAAIAENRPKASELLDSANSAVQSARTTIDDARTAWVPRGTSLLDNANAAVGSGQALIDELNLIVDREYPQVRQAITNVRLATASARLGVDEIRANPMRFFRGPSKDEKEREPLYAAARTYAEAVADLRVASESLDAVLARASSPSAVGVNPAEIQALTQSLRSAFAEYEQAERAMLEILADKARD